MNDMRPRLAVTAAFAAALVLLAAAAPAHAADLDGTVTRTATITTAGLDLSTAPGAAALHRRILRAAVEACRVDDPALVDITGDDFNACLVHTMQDTQDWAATQIGQAQAAVLARTLPLTIMARLSGNLQSAR